jgi:hypothetical protein
MLLFISNVLRKTRVIRILLFLLLLAGFVQSVFATSFGFNYSQLLIAKDPSNMHGYRAALTYQPQLFIWPCAQIYFDGGYGHWWVPNATAHNELNIYSVAPYFRYYFLKTTKVSPFVEASIGLSYLTQTRFDDRKLGIHFAFQDQLGLGLAYGKEQRLYTILTALHYSNGSMCRFNAGITAPLMLTVGYRF